MNNDLLKEVIDFAKTCSPVDSDTFASQFIEKDLSIIAEQIGPFFDTKYIQVGATTRAAHHGFLSIFIAAEMMRIIEDCGYRFWTEVPDGASDVWARTAWRVGLCISLGFIFSSHSVTLNYESWSPFSKTYRKFANGRDTYVKSSNRPLNGYSISAGIYNKLFPEPLGNNSMLELATQDVFSDRGSFENPIKLAFRRVIKRKLLTMRSLALPYWWIECINKTFESDENFIPVGDFNTPDNNQNSQSLTEAGESQLSTSKNDDKKELKDLRERILDFASLSSDYNHIEGMFFTLGDLAIIDYLKLERALNLLGVKYEGDLSLAESLRSNMLVRESTTKKVILDRIFVDPDEKEYELSVVVCSTEFSEKIMGVLSSLQDGEGQITKAQLEKTL